MLQIRDETAGVLLLTISDSGLICFGDGTPVSALSVNGTGVIDSNGQITNQRASGTTLVPASGSVVVNDSTVAGVSTASGRIPTVQLDTEWPAQSSLWDGTSCNRTDLWDQPVFTLRDVAQGFFNVMNNNQPDPSGLCAIDNGSGVANYRWF